LRAKLSEPGASDDVKSYDLVWLLHLVGDVHQPPKASAQLAAISDDKAWAAESFKIAKASVYRWPIGVGGGPFTLSSAYKARALSIAKARVALAGARLARMLNSALQ
jgi:S1/P1 Nuclease